MEVNEEISKIPNSVNHNSYPKETAGRIMTPAVPIILESFTIGDAEAIILKKVKEFETINYLYAVDKKGGLKGVISIKELFRQPKTTKISDVMEEKVVSARVHTDQEKVASLALKYSLKAVPVVDKHGVFLGVVQSDTIIQVLNEEYSEDVLYRAGVSEVNSASGIIQSKTKLILKARLPWLLVGLLGGVVAAFFIGRFEELLEEFLILALFVPVIVYMSDAVGAQTQTIFVRAVAIDHKFSIKKYFKKELLNGILMSSILAAILGLIVLVWFKSVVFSVVLALSLLITVFIAVLVGLMVPVIFLLLKKDTAVASGPFSTIISDVLSILVYFSVAQVLINLFGV
jgi:magnesium transporter